MSYSYTYDTRQDYMGFETLTDDQRRLGEDINAASRDTGKDRRDLLRSADAPAVNKVALAEVWGGRGAGAEFVQ